MLFTKYLVIAFVFPLSLFSQTVQGTITDPLTDKGIPNLTITIGDCTTVTDSMGHYVINLGKQVNVNKDDKQNFLPKEYSLSQNFPNPFNSETTILYQLPTTSNVVIKIYNIFGQEVKSFLNPKIQAGSHKFTWDGADNFGSSVSSGIYIVYFSALDFQKALKIILLK